jgi:hypothetical protein
MNEQDQSDGVELLDVLLTEAVLCNDMSAADFQVEIDFMMARNRAIAEFESHLRNGTLTPTFMDEFGDILNDHWIEPYAWLESVEMALGIT